MAITQVSGVSGFISPGDMVDLLLTHKIDDTAEKPILTPRRFSETILKGLRLLAIEQIVDASTGKPKVGQTVTIEVAPREAEIVALAASMGELSLSLRSVPAADISSSGEGGEEAETVTDIGVSKALMDHLILGTRRDPNLLQRRRELGRYRRADSSAGKATAKPKSRGNIDDGNRSITVYRATEPSTVVIKR
jgi:Flp pilus assembly protein CpaB